MIYIHVGWARAGSSTIQRFLSHNAEILRQRGYFVADPKLAIKAGRYMRTGKQRYKDAPDSLRDQIGSHPEADWIISSESLGDIPRESVQQFREMLPRRMLE